MAIKNADDKEKFRVDFDELMKINKDTVGWIRFYKGAFADQLSGGTGSGQ